MTASAQRPELKQGQDKPQQPDGRRLLAVPAPIRRVFARFPLTTYTSNPLPQRSKRRTSEHHLFVFRELGDKEHLSFNPACLKWQVRQIYHISDDD